MSVATTLQAIPLFAHLTDEELARMGELTRQRRHPKGSVILFEDDPGDALKSTSGERMVGTTKKEKDRRIELWVSNKGTWSSVLVLPNGRSCLKPSGPDVFTEKLRTAKTGAKRAT